MIIKSINIIKEGHKIVFTNGSSLVVSNETYLHFYLYENKVLDKDEYERLLKSVNLQEVLVYGARLFAKNRYSVVQFKEKLVKRNYSEPLIDQALAYFLEQGYLNDEVYGTDRLMYLNNVKKLGVNAIRRDLLKKGLNHFLVEDLIFHAYPEDNNQAFLKQLEKAISKYKGQSITKAHNQIYFYLMQKGFELSLIESHLTTELLDNSIDEWANIVKECDKLKRRKYSDDITKQKSIFKKLKSAGYPTNLIKKVMEAESDEN